MSEELIAKVKELCEDVTSRKATRDSSSYELGKLDGGKDLAYDILRELDPDRDIRSLRAKVAHYEAELKDIIPWVARMGKAEAISDDILGRRIAANKERMAELIVSRLSDIQSKGSKL